MVGPHALTECLRRYTLHELMYLLYIYSKELTLQHFKTETESYMLKLHSITYREYIIAPSHYTKLDSGQYFHT